MLMVVFGAGASHDSVPNRLPRPWQEDGLHYRPPLANQLFDDRRPFVDAMSKFPRCQPIIPFLRHLRGNESVESVLERLQTEAGEYPERHRQLAAIRYYLHFALWECGREWEKVAQGVTNYKTLLDQLERWRKEGERICLVTFNYDTMLETALPTVGIDIGGLPDYISSDRYKAIKLHGSVNWAREVDAPAENVGDRDEWQVAYELIDRAAELKISQRYRLVTKYPVEKIHGLRYVLFPAIAIPVESKRDYECPPEHLDALRACIPEMTKLLLIGWRATEKNFLQLLSKDLQHNLRVMVVTGGREAGEEVINRLQRAGIKGEFATTKGGFTEFIIRRGADKFLRS